jgi:hypothetical protein
MKVRFRRRWCDGTSRQRRYVRARRREAGEVARALRGALADKTVMKALLAPYPAGSDQMKLLRRGLDQILVDDPSTADFSTGCSGLSNCQ